jgi:hypothetical protein
MTPTFGDVTEEGVGLGLLGLHRIRITHEMIIDNGARKDFIIVERLGSMITHKMDFS